MTRLSLPENHGAGPFESTDSVVPPPARLAFGTLIALSAWCGLTAGLLEVAVTLVRKRFFDADQIIKLSHHFVWVIPILNLGIFLAFAVIALSFVLIWPDRGRRVFSRMLAALTLVPPLLAAFPKIHAAALLVLAIGIALRTVPVLESNPSRFRRFLSVGVPAVLCVVAMLGGSVWYRDHSKVVAEAGRPLPPPGSPNILIAVLDTVAASHASVNGYGRATTVTLEELAARGIRFQNARSTSSWTLPSHASMFTGLWPHEIPSGWLTPLDTGKPTIAEYLGNRGYATAGFIANTWYCGAGSGLSRGFARYEDYPLLSPKILKTCVIIKRAIEGYRDTLDANEDLLKSVGCLDAAESLWKALAIQRKNASEVNRELLDWLSKRDQPDRPFLAFLNYFDAHYPYALQPGRLHRFGAEPDDKYKKLLIDRWSEIDKSLVSPSGIEFVSDSYDDGIADLDEQVGKLVDQLDRRGILKNTWLVVVSDHGESFGEHPNIFAHGSSLFDTEVRVPLVIVPPREKSWGAASIVREPVSLRDIAATIVDLSGQTNDSPFPGDSLARYWKNPASPPEGSQPEILSELVPNDPKNRDYWGTPETFPPRASVKDSEWSYMRREVEVGEQLYHLTEDANEQHNLAQVPSAQETLVRFRASLDRSTKGPLVPSRFAP